MLCLSFKKMFRDPQLEVNLLDANQDKILIKVNPQNSLDGGAGSRLACSQFGYLKPRDSKREAYEQLFRFIEQFSPGDWTFLSVTVYTPEGVFTLGVDFLREIYLQKENSINREQR